MTTTNNTPALTELQFNVLTAYAFCEMTSANGGRPSNPSETHTYLWAAERAEKLGISERQLGGCLSSLVKKGFIAVLSQKDDPDGDGGFEMTAEGFAAWDAAYSEKHPTDEQKAADELALTLAAELRSYGSERTKRWGDFLKKASDEQIASMIGASSTLRGAIWKVGPYVRGELPV